MEANCSTTFVIREALPEDAPVIVTLCAQLGYPVEIQEIRERITRYQQQESIWIAVATGTAGQILGWIQVGEWNSLVDGQGVQIMGLVVDDRFRREGIGRQLVEGACNWAKSRGHGQVSVRSNAKRKGAHDFYPGLGFDLVKTQCVYKKGNLS